MSGLTDQLADIEEKDLKDVSIFLYNISSPNVAFPAFWRCRKSRITQR